jgi:hypothetical protein
MADKVKFKAFPTAFKFGNLRARLGQFAATALCRWFGQWA